MAEVKYYGGVEGGATNTTAIVVDSNGKIVSRVDGSGSNGWVCISESTHANEVIAAAKCLISLNATVPHTL